MTSFCFQVKEFVSMTGGGPGVFFEDDAQYIFALGVVKREKYCKLPFIYMFLLIP